MMHVADSRRAAVLAIALLCALFLLLQLIYIHRFPVIMDEYAFASSLHRLRTAVPFRDFQPYKSVLGEYIQAPVLWSAEGTWDGLMRVKTFNATLAAIVIGAVAAALTKLYSPRAVAGALALLFVMSTFAERAAELRVDMLTGLAGLVSLLALLRGRPFTCGVLCAASFAISQKGAYFAIAAVSAVATAVMLVRTREHWRTLLRLCAGGAAGGVVYVAFWFLFAPPGEVLRTTFVAPIPNAFHDIVQIRWTFWKQTLQRNPFFYAFAVGGLIASGRVMRARLERGDPRGLIAPYGAAIAVLGALHRQPWPYFFVIILPIFFVLCVESLEAWIARRRNRVVDVALVMTFAIGGIVLPLCRLPVALERDSSYQRTMVAIAEALLQPGETYIAGVDILWNRRQAVPDVQWLDGVRTMALRARPPLAQEDLLRRVAATPTKLLIVNYRVHALPQPLGSYLSGGYARFFGSIYLYAPVIGNGTLDLRFDGTYRAQTARGIVIDGRSLENGREVVLRRGSYPVSGEGRLLLQPALPALEVDSRHAAYQEFFPNVYGF